MQIHLKLLIIATAALAVGCGGGSSPTSPGQGASVELVSVSAVTGDRLFFVAGQTRQLQATVQFSNGSSQTVTSGVTWQSANPSAASVSAGGLVTAIGPGSAGITATYQGVRSVGSWVAEVRIPPTISGTWDGTYHQLELAGLPGFMTWTLTQTGNSVSGTIFVPDDFRKGRINGSIQGSFQSYPNERRLVFTITVPRGGMSREPTCSMLITGTTSPMAPVPTTIGTSYLGNWCDGPPGVGFAWFDGTLSLTKK